MADTQGKTGQGKTREVDYQSFRLFMDNQEVLLSDRVRTLFTEYFKAVEQGEAWAIRDMMDRLLGRPPQSVEVTGEQPVSAGIFVTGDFKNE